MGLIALAVTAAIRVPQSNDRLAVSPQPGAEE